MDNESDKAMALNDTNPYHAPVYLKQSIPMMVVYTLAYSAVFFLGIILHNMMLTNNIKAAQVKCIQHRKGLRFSPFTCWVTRK